MKILRYLLIFFLLIGTAHAKIEWHAATSLTGGGVGAADAIDGIALEDGDVLIVVTSTSSYFYLLDADSALAESSPDIISPDSNAADKRWILTTLNLPNALFLKERAAATTDVPDYGQIWVKDNTPNLLYFTDDSGVDYQLGGTDFDYLVTTKTAAAINTAITAANAAGGGIVVLSSGEYDLTGATPITMLSNVTLSGYGATLLGDGELSYLIEGATISNAKIMGVELDGGYTGAHSYLGATTGGENGMGISGSNIGIEDCYVHDFQYRGIVVSSLSDSKLVKNHIVSCGMGIRLIADLDKIELHNNYIEDTFAGGITIATGVGQSTTSIDIVGNIIDTTACSETMVAQNIVTYSGDDGAGASGTIKYIDITGNVLIGKDHGCIRVGGDYHTIVGNICYGSEIRVGKTNDATNRYESSHILIAHNVIVDFGGDLTIDDGIFIRDGAYIDVIGNTLEGTEDANHGIFFAYVQKGKVINNSIEIIGGDGIRFQDSTKIDCYNNTVVGAGTGVGNTGYGIYLNNAIGDLNESIVIKNNRLSGNPDGEIVNTSAGVNHRFSDNGGLDVDLYSNWTNSYLVAKKGTFYLYNNTDRALASVPDSSTFLYCDDIEKLRTLPDAGDLKAIRTAGSVSLLEQAAAGGDIAAYGQVWVKEATPNSLYFTDDAGTDFAVGGVAAGIDEVEDDIDPDLGGDLESNSNDIIMGDSAADDRIFFGDDSDMYLGYNGAGDFLAIRGADDGILAKFEKNGASYLCYDNAIKLKADSFGIDIVDELRMRDDLNLYIGTDNNARIFYDEAGTDTFQITDTDGDRVFYAADLAGSSYGAMCFEAAAKISTWNTGVGIAGTVNIAEQAASAVDLAGFGQVWVKNIDPNELWFTDDRGTDVQLGIAAGIDEVEDDIDPDLGGDLESNSNDIIMGDSAADDRIFFGDDSDMYLGYNGAGDFLAIRGADDGILAKFEKNGASYLCYDNAIKLKADSFGIDIVDELRMRDDLNLYIGTDNNARIFYDEAGTDTFQITDTDGDRVFYAADLAGSSYGAMCFEAAAKISTWNTGVGIAGTVNIAEQAASAVDLAGFGQVWVKNIDPNELWFTDDRGTDVQLGIGTDDQTIDSLSLGGTTLSISLEGDGEAAQTVDLSGLQDGTGGDMDDLSDDLSPQLGGGLDCQGYDLTDLDDILMLTDDKVKFNNMYMYMHTASPGQIEIRDADGSVLAYFKEDGASGILYNGTLRVDTTASGVDINGNLDISGTATASCGTLTCDYVFEDDYDLFTLDELQKYADTYDHLPNMTINNLSDETGGLDYSKGIIELLVKVEEQALYILQLHERLKAVESKLAQLN